MPSKQARVFGKQNLIADFLRCNADLGDIYQLDDGGWVVITNIFRLLPDLKKKDFLLKASTKKDLTYSRETGTEVKFSGSGTTGQIGVDEAEVVFSGKNSAFVSLKKASWQNLDLMQIQPILQKLWNDHGYYKRRERYFFVNQLCTAESGVTIFSSDKNNAVKLRSKISQPLANLGSIAEANLEIVANKKETLEIICNEVHAPLFQAVRMRKNGSWEILG